MLSNRLYVGNLYCMVNKEQLKLLFSKYGEVKDVSIVPGTGYAYVEMGNILDAEKAKRALDGAEYLERILRVKDAEPTHPYTRGDVSHIIK